MIDYEAIRVWGWLLPLAGNGLLVWIWWTLRKKFVTHEDFATHLAADEQHKTATKECLAAHDVALEALADKVNAMPYVKQRKMRPLFAYATRCELDSQGRILLPQSLRDFAGLEKSVTVVGSNNHAEFWDSDSWQSVRLEEITPENIAAVMEELEF